MREKGFGRVVMTTSSAGLYGNHGHTNYGTAKMALIGLMNSLKEEGRRYNISVNAIAPIALTRMSEPATTPQYAPLMKPEFVTAAVAWLCAPDNTDSGHIIQAGVGYYSKIEVREAPERCLIQRRFHSRNRFGIAIRRLRTWARRHHMRMPRP